MNIFVGNLSQQTDEKSIYDIFEKFGVISSVKLVKDKYTGKYRGFAFVEMFSESEALEAIKALNNKSFLGKRIVVNNRER